MGGQQMTSQELLNIIENAVMVEENSLTLDTDLDSLEDWDSLALATILSSVEEEVSANFNAADFKGAKKVADIINLINKNVE
jgi:acyl carrier protein